MKLYRSRSPNFLAGGLALALMAVGAFAATPPPPPDPDPTAKGMPMQDVQSPTQSSSPTQSMSSKKMISMQEKFDSLDINRDGYISKQEAAADPQLQSQFDALDANRDGKLSMSEFKNAQGLAMSKNPESSENERQ